MFIVAQFLSRVCLRIIFVFAKMAVVLDWAHVFIVDRYFVWQEWKYVHFEQERAD